MDQPSKKNHSERHPHAASSGSKTHIEEKYIGEETLEQPGADNELDNIHDELKTIRAFMAHLVSNHGAQHDSKNVELGYPKVVRSRSRSPDRGRSRSRAYGRTWGRGWSPVHKSVFDGSPVRRRRRSSSSHNRPGIRMQQPSPRFGIVPPTIQVPIQAPQVVQPGPYIVASTASEPIQPTQMQSYRWPGFPSQDNRILDSVITDFSSIVVIATFMASVSIGLLTLANNLIDKSPVQNISENKTLYVILQIFGSLSLSFNLAVAIIAGGAASNQSARLRAGLRAKPYTKQQGLEQKLQLCSAMQYYGLLALTVATGCLFGLLLNSPFAIIMIIPVIGVVFYDSLYKGPLSNSSEV